jgi:glycogenin glucosyltransferase
MDTDILVMGALDELFSYPMLSCAADPLPPQICNTGVLVIEPRSGLFDQMMETVHAKKLFHGPGDQGFINSFFGSFTPIPSVYNIPRTQNTGLARALKLNMSKLVHMVCKKPWKCGREGVSYCGCGYPSLNTQWWNTWDRACEGRQCIESWKE